jgi:hypothetical protein
MKVQSVTGLYTGFAYLLNLLFLILFHLNFSPSQLLSTSLLFCVFSAIFLSVIEEMRKKNLKNNRETKNGCSKQSNRVQIVDIKIEATKMISHPTSIK